MSRVVAGTRPHRLMGGGSSSMSSRWVYRASDVDSTVGVLFEGLMKLSQLEGACICSQGSSGDQVRIAAFFGVPPEKQETVRAALRQSGLWALGTAGSSGEAGPDAAGTFGRIIGAGFVAAVPLASQSGSRGLLVLWDRRPDAGSRVRDLVLQNAGGAVWWDCETSQGNGTDQIPPSDLAQENGRLQQVGTFNYDLASLFSHELRTPLASISAHTWALLDYWDRFGDEDKRRSIVSIARHCSRLERLVSDLLVLSRVEAGVSLELDLAPVDLVELVKQVVEDARDMYPDHVLEWAGPEAVPHIQGDRSRLEQVLVNLIDNGVKYSPGGTAVRVLVAEEQRGLQVSVTDQGAGIAASDLPRLFQRYQRLGGASYGGRPGTGIGLYLCRLIVEAHGGRICAESPGPGKGSTFTYWLPKGTTP